jgi:ankyrin repeat protein
MVKLLLDTGKVDPDRKDPDGMIPLARAVQGGNREVVKLLLDTRKVGLDLFQEGTS